MPLGEVGGPRAKTPLEAACATGELPDVRGTPSSQVFGDAFAHQLGHRAFLHPRLGLERSCLLLGQLDPSSYHAVTITNQRWLKEKSSSSCRRLHG